MWKRFTIAALALAFLISPSYALEITDFKANPIPVKTYCYDIKYIKDIRKSLSENGMQFTVQMVGIYLQMGFCHSKGNYVPLKVDTIISSGERYPGVEDGFLITGTVVEDGVTKRVWSFLRESYLKKLIHPEA